MEASAPLAVVPAFLLRARCSQHCDWLSSPEWRLSIEVTAAITSCCHFDGIFHLTQLSTHQTESCLSIRNFLEQKRSMLPYLRSIHSRRSFLLGVSACSLAGILPSQLAAQVAGPQNFEQNDPQLAVIPRDSLLKFNLDGTPRRFAGNTVICH